ncbi:MFS transporter [Lewinella sp. W8]|uniref:MFS transporter n=1 Tax=Lewinella sp. W8 TaxID=2528208 RepID=UPI001068743D|nr:MFS transporter [Lewinella sp. W8]MTB53611.1 MFS transporter [Lewinella sp. W8]
MSRLIRQSLRRLIQLYFKSYNGLPFKVWMIALVLLVNRSGAMVVAFLSVYLINAQGFNPIKAGYVMMFFGAGGIVGNYVGGILNDRFGSWHLMFFSMIGSGILYILLGQTTDFWLLCLLAFMISVVADAFRPASRAAITYYAPREKLTQAFGLQRMAVNLGFSVGPALGGFLIGNYGYELLFWGDGLTCLLAAAVFYLVLPPDETTRPLVARPGRTPANTAELLDAAPAATPTTPALKQSWMILFGIANMAIILCFFQFFSTVPVYLKEVGYSEQQVGYLITLSGLIIVLVEMPLLYLTEPRFRPVTVMLLGTALIILAYLILPTTAVAWLPLAFMIAILTLGEILYMPFTSSYVSHHAPRARLGEYQGVLSASYSAAFVLGPFIGFGVAEHYGYEAAFYVCSGVALLGWLLLTRVDGLREKVNLRSGRPLPSSG